MIGASFALSSTAFVIQMLRDQGEIASAHGQTAFAVLLMQDLAVVPLLAGVPLLADAGTLPAALPLWQQIGKALGMIGLVLVGGRFLVPRALDHLARTHNREAFLLATLAAVLIAATAVERAGMSMALGAFLMGMMLSTSRYSLQIEASLEPHKGLLMSLFFVAVGMSVDLGELALHPVEFALHVLAIIVIKVAVLYALCLGFGTGRGTALKVAFLLAQGGEFGFVLFGAAKALTIIDDRLFVMAVAIISLTMLITPLLARLGNRLARRMPGETPGVAEHLRYSASGDEPAARVVIGGYGRVGHTVGTILTSSGIPYVAFDTNTALVARWRNEGHPVFYGDIVDPLLLATGALQGVDLVVLTIDDQTVAVRAAAMIRSHAPQMTIVARARDLVSCDALFRAGVNTAFPETLEASLRLAAESLQALGVSTGETDLLLHGVRSTDYALVRYGPEGRGPRDRQRTTEIRFTGIAAAIGICAALGATLFFRWRAAREKIGKLQIMPDDMACQPVTDEMHGLRVDPEGTGAEFFRETEKGQIQFLVQRAVLRMGRIPCVGHDRLFMLEMLLGVVHQQVEDLPQCGGVGAAHMIVVEFVDQIEKVAMLVVDHLDPDTILLPPTQKGHCSSS
jgi:glutathione-regulated potassium-efflux system ancillary protein KefC